MGKLFDFGAKVHIDHVPEMTVAELDALLQRDIEDSEAAIEATNERLALMCPGDGKTTAERALDVLQRPERFNGEHAVALKWLQDYAPNACIFRKTNQ